jgi:Transposase domain (DUF772)
MGRPSIDPELMVRMLIIGYVFAIRSERAICRDVQVNLAYRWFCGLSIDDKIPDHSAFSRARHERFRDSDMFRRVFERVVEACIEAGLVGGEGFAVDVSLIVADANKEAWIAAVGLRFPETVVEKEYQDYFCEMTFVIAQFAMLLAAATYVVYGPADMAMESSGVLSTRFRFMIALPLMATFFALSFRPFARRHPQCFIIAFGVVAMVCTYVNVYLIGVAAFPHR